MIIDLQVNQEGKDGAPVDPAVLIEGAKQAGLDGLVVTKENAFFEATDAVRAAAKEQGVTVFAGAKIPTTHGLLLCVLPDPSTPLPADWARQSDGMYEAESVIDDGFLDPDTVVTPGIFVQRLITSTERSKEIEQRTVRSRESLVN